MSGRSQGGSEQRSPYSPQFITALNEFEDRTCAALGVEAAGPDSKPSYAGGGGKERGGAGSAVAGAGGWLLSRWWLLLSCLVCCGSSCCVCKLQVCVATNYVASFSWLFEFLPRDICRETVR